MTKRFIPGKLLAPLLLLLALSATPARSQQQSVETDPESEKPTAVEPETEPAESAEQDEDPFDYRSSEEISEDLSVSFPVDI